MAVRGRCSAQIVGAELGLFSLSASFFFHGQRHWKYMSHNSCSLTPIWIVVNLDGEVSQHLLFMALDIMPHKHGFGRAEVG